MPTMVSVRLRPLRIALKVEPIVNLCASAKASFTVTSSARPGYGARPVFM